MDCFVPKLLINGKEQESILDRENKADEIFIISRTLDKGKHFKTRKIDHSTHTSTTQEM